MVTTRVISASQTLFSSDNIWTGQQNIDGGTRTANFSPTTLIQTWNNAAVTFVADYRNITDTASGAGSLLASWNVGNAARFHFGKDGSLRLANSLLSGDTTFGYFQGGGSWTQELTVRTAAAGLNVMAFQNTQADGVSAVAFRASDGVERAAVGYANAGTSAPFAGKSFLEASYFTGSSHSTAPSALLFAQTGYWNGSYAARARQEFNNNGDTFFYAWDGATVSMKLKNTGLVGVGPIDPAVQLHVFRAAADEVARFEANGAYAYASVKSTNGTMLMGIDATGGWVGPSSNKPLSLKANDTEYVRVLTTGVTQFFGAIKLANAAVTETVVQAKTVTVIDSAGTTIKLLAA